MPSPTAYGYVTLTDQTRSKVWEHPRTGHIIEIRRMGGPVPGTGSFSVFAVPQGTNTSEKLKGGFERMGPAVEYAGRYAKGHKRGGTPAGGSADDDFDFTGGGV